MSRKKRLTADTLRTASFRELGDRMSLALSRPNIGEAERRNVSADAHGEAVGWDQAPFIGPPMVNAS